ncbi:MAG TPA: hypothetical protein VHG31_07020 [Stellaceae bacterium]|nr:hypothetical protein [Stellaceae bacterium]
MLSGTLVTAVGLMPVGFPRSSAGEYAGNIFWIVGFALTASWIVAVAFSLFRREAAAEDQAEDIRTVDVVARSAGAERLDPARFANFTRISRDGRMIPVE